MKPEEIKALRDTLGRTQVGMAHVIGASPLTIGRWERGETHPLPIYLAKLVKLQKYVDGKLAEVTEP